jgi:pilus assembly protein CpaC
LVIIVTPRLVRPARPDQKLRTPLDGRVASNDVEFFLGGAQEINVGRPEPDRGHILDLGPVGRKK